MIVAFTPLRSGTKGIPLDDIRRLNGIPLFHHVVLEAQKVSSLDEVWISIDSESFASLIPPGVLVHKRPKESVTNRAHNTTDVVVDFVKSHPYVKTLVFLQATSPSVTSKDIEEALRLSSSGLGCVSVHTTNISLYFKNQPIWLNKQPRQDAKMSLADGAIYVIHTADFLKTTVIPTIPCITMQLQNPVRDVDLEQDFFELPAVLFSRSRTTARIDVYEDNVRLKSKSCTDQWSIQALCESGQTLKSYVLQQIKHIDESDIDIRVNGTIMKEDGQNIVAEASETNSFSKGCIIPEFMDGKYINVSNEEDSAIMAIARRNDMSHKNILLLVFGTEIRSGLFLNGKVLTNSKVGKLLEPEFSTNFGTSDPNKLVEIINKIKNTLALDYVYVAGAIKEHKDYMRVLEENGIHIEMIKYM